MKKKERRFLRNVLLGALAGLAVAQFAQEIPAMIRYIKMKRL